MPTKMRSSITSIEMQLQQINERLRWTGSQLWQVPFAYFGVIGLVIATIFDKGRLMIGLSLLSIAILGLAAIIHMILVGEEEKRAIEDIQKLEEGLSLPVSVINRKGLKWLPLLFCVILVVVALLVISILFIIYAIYPVEQLRPTRG